MRKFFDYVAARQMAWYNKQHGISPVTDDPILSKRKLCNNYRESDAGTILLLDCLKRWKLKSSVTLFNIIAYRIFNFPIWLKDLHPEPIQPSRFSARMEIPYLEGASQMYRSLFNIRAYGIYGRPVTRVFPEKDKVAQACAGLEMIASDLDRLTRLLRNCQTGDDAVKLLKTAPMIGVFLAYQIVLDLTYMGFWQHRITDNTFYQIGPKADRALRRMFPVLTSLTAPAFRHYGTKMFDSMYEAQWRSGEQLEQAMKRSGARLRWANIAYPDRQFDCPHMLSRSNLVHALGQYAVYLRHSGKDGAD